MELLAAPAAWLAARPWLTLVCAGAMEIVWAVGLKYTAGFTRPLASLAVAAAIVASVMLLGLAARSLPIGVAYAVWSGIGAVGAVLAGTLLLGDPLSLRSGFFLALIVTGIVGLKLG